MTPSRLALTATLALAGAALSGCAAVGPAAVPVAPASATRPGQDSALASDLDRIFAVPALDRALLAVRVESLHDGRLLYARNAGARMVPASVLKIVTAAVAADRLGWQHRFETRLETTGRVVDGVLEGDLIVVGGGDPTIAARDLASAPLFDEWADLLVAAGVLRIDGRLIGDDSAFDDEPLGAGWAWDYLTAAYAAPSGALSYNENLVAVTTAAGPETGAPARITIGPPGHGLTVSNHVTTAAPGGSVSLALERLPGSGTLTVRGEVPLGADAVARATTVVNPTAFFVEALRAALANRLIEVRDGAHDIDDVADLGEATRRTLATHRSPTLAAIVAQMMKVSQNFYGEMLIKAAGRTAGDARDAGSTQLGRRVARQTLEAWQIPADGLVMHDGSGLSRYNYASADLLAAVLRRMWLDEKHRGPFAASLPVSGHDGTLAARMTGALRRRVQAKTGTIANVRSLAGYAETEQGEKLVFVMIANHFVAPNADVDAAMERGLERILSGPD